MSARTRSIWATVRCAPASAATGGPRAPDLRRVSWPRRAPAPAWRPRRAPAAGCAGNRRSRREPTGGSLLGPPPAVLPDQGTRRHEPGQELLDQERQPVAVLGDEGRHGTVDLGIRQAGVHHVRAPGVRQGGEGQDRADPAAPQPVEQVRDARGPDGPGGGQAQHPLGGEGVGEVADHRQRLRVRPVQILQHEQAPGGTAEHPEKPDHRFADEHGGVVGAVGRVARPPVRHKPGELGAEAGQLACVGRLLPSARLEQGLAQRTERERGPGRDGTAGRHEKAAIGGERCCLPGQPGLADAGLAHQSGEPASTVGCVRDEPDEGCQLFRPADDHRTEDTVHREQCGPHRPAHRRSWTISSTRPGRCRRPRT